MKAFRIISAALMAVLMAACFTACSKMENDEPQKRLTKMTFSNSSYNFSYTFNYDNGGLLKSSALEAVINDPYPMTMTYTYNYVWNSRSIDVMATLSSEEIGMEQEEYTIHLSEGLASSTVFSSGSEPDETYGYDSSSRLTRIDQKVVTWNNDMLTSVTLDNGDHLFSESYTYGKAPQVKGYSPLIINAILGENLFMAHPELVGMKTGQTPDSQISSMPDTPSQQTTFEYELNKDGYISKITATSTQQGYGTWTSVYTLVWE